MEVVLVVDGSFSIGATTFNNNVKAVLRNFATILFYLGKDVSVGLVLYSHVIDKVIDLTDDVTRYRTGVDGLPYPAGGTYTDLGIKSAAEMFRRLGKAGVTKIMIVITDGQSANPQRTSQEAAAARRSNITIFAAGVGHTPTSELQAMATSPQHVLTADNYDEMSTLLAGLTKNCAVDGGWTEWRRLGYGPCSSTCGPGTQLTYEIRYCSNPTPRDGGASCINSNTRIFSEQCTKQVPCPSSGLCDDVKMVNGVGFRLHPRDCDKFIQCYSRPDGYTLGVVRTCSYGRYWNQEEVMCDEACRVDCPIERCKNDCISTYKMDGSCRGYWSCDEEKSEPQCCPMGFAYVSKRGCLLDFTCRDQCPMICTGEEVCNSRPVWTDAHRYEQSSDRPGWVENACMKSSLYFDIVACQCSTAPTTECRPRMTMDFSNPNQLTTDPVVVVSRSNLEVTGKVAVFSGNSKITTDISIRSPGYPISIRLNYREAAAVNSRQVLVAAPWCKRASSVSMVIFVDKNVIGFEVKNWYGMKEHMTIPTDGFSLDEWKDVLFAYDGKYLTGTVQSGKNKHASRVYAPKITMVECGLDFGSDGTTSTFNGQMDLVSFSLVLLKHSLSFVDLECPTVIYHSQFIGFQCVAEFKTVFILYFRMNEKKQTEDNRAQFGKGEQIKGHSSVSDFN
ncbi:protein PIF-like [Gigantopelta aegis]|uniref:protein PIF-like n=1 Tax=Gigantopelta aegis TaxID=1735272 RepID=UPI001B88E316|nr:protein PIF-like [Gigantopelta aegis]